MACGETDTLRGIETDDPPRSGSTDRFVVGRAVNPALGNQLRAETKTSEVEGLTSEVYR
jgi:hypothetical protein